MFCQQTGIYQKLVVGGTWKFIPTKDVSQYTPTDLQLNTYTHVSWTINRDTFLKSTSVVSVVCIV